MEKVGIHGLDEKVIAIRAREAEKEYETMDAQEKDDVDKEIISELENTHIDEKVET